MPIALVIAMLLGASVTALAYTQLGGHDLTVRDLRAPIAGALGYVAPVGPDLTVPLSQAPIVATQPPVAEVPSSVAVGQLPKLNAGLRSQLQRYESRSIFGVEGRMLIPAVRVAMRAGLAAGMTTASRAPHDPGVERILGPVRRRRASDMAAVNPGVVRPDRCLPGARADHPRQYLVGGLHQSRPSGHRRDPCAHTRVHGDGGGSRSRRLR